jgi:release factor glutamine methyltransferase
VTVAEAVSALTARLAAAGVPTPRVDAELLACHVLGWSRTQLLVRANSRLPDDAAALLDGLGDRRAVREPLQLIVGSVGFRTLDLLVRREVFVPRPETELLAEAALACLPVGGVVVESCAGTGAVACALAAEGAPSLVLATDVSLAAVELARANAARNHVDVAVAHGDLLDPVPDDLRGQVDVLVSNPPYLAAAELAATEPEVRDWDPHDALVAGPSGHEVTDRLLALAPAWLRPGGWVLLEVDETRAAETAGRAAAAGLADAEVLRDLTGRDRFVRARRP